MAAEQLREEPPWAEFTMEVEEVEHGEPRLRRVGELPHSRSCAQVVGVDEVPRRGRSRLPHPRLAREEAAPSMSFVTGDVLLRGTCQNKETRWQWKSPTN